MMTLPYGSWPSPISAEDLAAAGVRLGGPRYDGADLYWTQSRPAEAGRTALLRERDGLVTEVASGVNVRTRVHEYGGGAWDVRDGVVVVSADPSGQLLRLDGDPRPLTPQDDRWRFADLRVHPELGIVLAVREDHSEPGEPVNTLVVLRLDEFNTDGGTVLVSGADFYATPELSHDGRLAWMEWRHPDMPWDACLVREGRFAVSTSGAVVDDVRTVAGGPGESAVHPAWRGRELLFCSDRSGFWELYSDATSAAPRTSATPPAPTMPPARPASATPPTSDTLPAQPTSMTPTAQPTSMTPPAQPTSSRPPTSSRRMPGSQSADDLTQLTDGDADLVEPFWVFGRRPYALLGDGSVVVRPRIDGRSAPMLLADGGYRDLASGVVDCDSLDAASDRIAALVQFTDAPDAIIELRDARWRIVDAAAPRTLAPEWVSVAEEVMWQGSAGEVHGWFYPPVNPLANPSSVELVETPVGGLSLVEPVETPASAEIRPIVIPGQARDDEVRPRVQPGQPSSSAEIPGQAWDDEGRQQARDDDARPKVQAGQPSSSVQAGQPSSRRTPGSRPGPGSVTAPTDLPPLIVISHGGPTAFSTAGFSPGVQFWTTRGFAVLDVNYSGSSGYGRAYRERLRGDWGVLDVADCIAGAQALADVGRVDGSRLAIRGGSAGGYTTLRALTTSDVFGAGCSRYGIGDLAALASDTHKFEARYLDGLIGPWPAAEVYAERSPINHVDALNCPMLILQGAEDAVVPPNQAETMAAAVAAKGLDVELIVFEGEGHGFRKAETICRALNAELAFYARTFGITLPA